MSQFSAAGPVSQVYAGLKLTEQFQPQIGQACLLCM